MKFIDHFIIFAWFTIESLHVSKNNQVMYVILIRFLELCVTFFFQLVV